MREEQQPHCGQGRAGQADLSIRSTGRQSWQARCCLPWLRMAAHLLARPSPARWGALPEQRILKWGVRERRPLREICCVSADNQISLDNWASEACRNLQIARFLLTGQCLGGHLRKVLSGSPLCLVMLFAPVGWWQSSASGCVAPSKLINTFLVLSFSLLRTIFCWFS